VRTAAISPWRRSDFCLQGAIFQAKVVSFGDGQVARTGGSVLRMVPPTSPAHSLAMRQRRLVLALLRHEMSGLTASTSRERKSQLARDARRQYLAPRVERVQGHE
jgi:hypothetical protein